MSFIATAIIGGIGLAGIGGGAYEGYKASATKPNYSNVKDPYQQVEALVPGLPTMTSTAAGNIQSELNGQLSPDVTAQIRNAGATWGAANGMPGSGAAGDVTLESLGLTSLQEKQQGLSDYTNFLTAVSGQQMPISEQMTVDNAAAAANPQGQYLSSILSGIGGSLLGVTGGSSGGIGGILSSLLGAGSTGSTSNPSGAPDTAPASYY